MLNFIEIIWLIFRKVNEAKSLWILNEISIYSNLSSDIASNVSSKLMMKKNFKVKSSQIWNALQTCNAILYRPFKFISNFWLWAESWLCVCEWKVDVSALFVVVFVVGVAPFACLSTRLLIGDKKNVPHSNTSQIKVETFMEIFQCRNWKMNKSINCFSSIFAFGCLIRLIITIAGWQLAAAMT